MLLEKYQRWIIWLNMALIVSGALLWNAEAVMVKTWWPLLAFLNVPLMVAAIRNGAIQRKRGWWFVGSFVFLLLGLLAGLSYPQFVMVPNGLGNEVLTRIKEVWNTSAWRPVSMERWIAVREGAVLCGSIAMGAVMVWLMNRERIREVLQWVFYAGVGLSVVGLILHLTGQTKLLGVWAGSGESFAGFDHPGFWASFGVLCAGAGLSLFEYNLRRVHKREYRNSWWLPLLLSLLILAAVAIGAPQMGGLGAAILGIVLLGMGLQKGFHRFKFMGGWQFGMFVLILGVSLVIFLGWGGWQLWKQTGPQKLLAQWEELGGESMPEPWLRNAIREDTQRMGEQRNYWGWGLGSYETVFSEKFAGEKFQEKHLPLHPGFSEIVHVDTRTVRFRPNFAAFPQSQDLPNNVEYAVHYNRPLKFPWDPDFRLWRQRSTEITFLVYLNQIVLDERTVKVFLDPDANILRLDDPEIPSLLNWNFKSLKEEEGQVAKDNAGWLWEIYDRNTVKIQNYADGKTSPFGDGLQTQVTKQKDGGVIDALPNSLEMDFNFARIHVGKFDSNSIWADYLNGPYFRLISQKAYLKDGEFYTFLIRARRGANIIDENDPPALSLEMGPEEHNKFQEFLLARPGTDWRSYYISAPYWDYKDGNFSIRRSSKYGKAAGATLDIDNVEVFHHESPGGIGVSATGVGSHGVRLNFFYKGIYHPVEVRADKMARENTQITVTRFAYNDYLEYWVELGWFGVIAWVCPLLGLLYRVWNSGATSSITRWLFLSCSIVGIQAFFDSPLQHPAVLWLLVLTLTMAIKYSLLQGKERRKKARKK